MRRTALLLASLLLLVGTPLQAEEAGLDALRELAPPTRWPMVEAHWTDGTTRSIGLRDVDAELARFATSGPDGVMVILMPEGTTPGANVIAKSGGEITSFEGSFEAIPPDLSLPAALRGLEFRTVPLTAWYPDGTRKTVQPLSWPSFAGDALAFFEGSRDGGFVLTAEKGVVPGDGPAVVPQDPDLQSAVYLRKSGDKVSALFTREARTVPAADYAAQVQRRGSSLGYSDCAYTVWYLREALGAYAREHGGRYPANLAELSPRYLEAVPACRAAGKDTYSGSYTSAGSTFRFCCQGANHTDAGAPANMPAATEKGVEDPLKT